MSKATMELHHNIKKPGSIIFTAIIAFIGGAIFPGGLIIILIFTGLDQYLFSLPEVITDNLTFLLLSVGVFAALYSIISDIGENAAIHKRVIIELLSENEAIKKSLE